MSTSPQDEDVLAALKAMLKGNGLPAIKWNKIASMPPNVTINFPQIVFRITYKDGWFHVFVGLVKPSEQLEDLTLKSIRSCLDAADTLAKCMCMVINLNRDNIMGYQTHLFTTEELQTGGVNIPQELKQMFLELI